MTTLQAHPQEPQWDTGYGGGYSGYYEGGSYYLSQGYPEPSLQAKTVTFARYPDWYAPLERYVSYVLEWQMDDFAHVQMEMQASIDSQTTMLHDLFCHFGTNPDA
jgi:hypothetical protein